MLVLLCYNELHCLTVHCDFFAALSDCPDYLFSLELSVWKVFGLMIKGIDWEWYCAYPPILPDFKVHSLNDKTQSLEIKLKNKYASLFRKHRVSLGFLKFRDQNCHTAPALWHIAPTSCLFHRDSLDTALKFHFPKQVFIKRSGEKSSGAVRGFLLAPSQRVDPRHVN